MKKGDRISLIKKEILDINHLLRILDIKIRKFEIAYAKRNSLEFNTLKKDILLIQRKIKSMIK